MQVNSGSLKNNHLHGLWINCIWGPGINLAIVSKIHQNKDVRSKNARLANVLKTVDKPTNPPKYEKDPWKWPVQKLVLPLRTGN